MAGTAGSWLSDGPANLDKYTQGVKRKTRRLAWWHHHQHCHEVTQSWQFIFCLDSSLWSGILVLLFWNLGKKFDQMLSLSHGHLPLNILAFYDSRDHFTLSNFLWREWKDFPNLYWGFLGIQEMKTWWIIIQSFFRSLLFFGTVREEFLKAKKI